MFSVLRGYIDEKLIPWDRMLAFCTDGAPSRRDGGQASVALRYAAGNFNCKLYRTRLFAKLCGDMGSDHDIVLFNTEAWWLSRGSLGKIFHVKRGTVVIQNECKNTDLLDFLCNEKKMCLLAYITDIFGKLNELNASMQGIYNNILQVSD